jgi:hypothetical protein
MASVLELSRYCIPWTPFRKRLEDSIVMLATTAAVHHQDQPPFNVDGDLTFRVIEGTTPVSNLRIADAHYDHACVDADVNTVFPLDRLHELASGQRRIGAVAEKHFSTGFTQELRRFKEEVVPQLAAEIAKLRPDCVIFTGG